MVAHHAIEYSLIYLNPLLYYWRTEPKNPGDPTRSDYVWSRRGTHESICLTDYIVVFSFL